ncbi:MAG: alpha-amylase [Lachnospiraceae bacterium]|nr:alpha-amylase [Lachnospiraceae bacterium]
MGNCKKKKVFKRIMFTFAVSIMAMAGIAVANNKKNKASAASVSINGTMFQGFEWYIRNDGKHWSNLSSKASSLANAGITAVWLPPAYKGSSSDDVGYGVYDLYDLGEFNQKGTTRTKYGTKAQYTSLISSLHRNNIQVYADIVLNHKNSADAAKTVSAYECSSTNRNATVKGPYNISAWCVFNFPGRNGKYSTFTWDDTCFDGIDWDDSAKKSGIYRFAGKSWETEVDLENGNYDYLMSCDLDFDNSKVVSELKTWGKWYVSNTGIDGFRLDAVKHIKASFYKDWLRTLRSQTGKELFSVGEYWSGSVSTLKSYISTTGGTTSLFDVPLHYNFYSASTGNGNYDMRKLFSSTLVASNPTLAVTFVDNHDSQPGQSLASTVSSWFKPLAYTAILTRESGYPCVFYGDYYGTGDGRISSQKTVIDKILTARKNYAYGTQHDYLDNANIIGWTREGNSSHANSGLAALITDNAGGSKTMYVGKSHAQELWYDITGNVSGNITIGSDGYATFKVNGGSHSIWVPTGKKATTNTSVDNGNTNNGNNSTTNNTVTLYYYNSNNWSNVYCHYCPDGGNWTEIPGIKMSLYSGKYYYVTLNLGSATRAQVCFNNNQNSWDSNYNNNYIVRNGTYTVVNGSVYTGKP